MLWGEQVHEEQLRSGELLRMKVEQEVYGKRQVELEDPANQVHDALHTSA